MQDSTFEMEETSPPSKRCRDQALDYLAATPSYEEFLDRYLLPLKPCLIAMPELSLWGASQRWLKQTDDGPSPDIDGLERAFRDSQVDVAFCEETDEYGGQRRDRMLFSEFATIWRENPNAKLYLKDFHFCIAGQSAAHQTPEIFADDWLNSYSISKSRGADDFRFVYLGQDGSNTNFHRDVYGSHSWSCSLAGTKRWRFLAPEFMHLVRDETTGDMPAGLFLPGIESQYPRITNARERVLTIWQYPGEAVFVPSGWLHEVKNFGETLSVNHNWANTACLHRMAGALQDEVRLGQSALDGFNLGSPEEVAILVQDLTVRNFGWGWKEFFEMIKWRYTSRDRGRNAIPRVPIKQEVAWEEAPDDLRPSPKVEGQIVSQVIQDWLGSNDSKYLPQAKAVAEDVLKHVQGVD
ncbi:Clavaminate synthase-like protein [Heliocybe sulcata]|uniref:Clavaminate synthase-like protein n=1 Tax=Heliocybe sulcata TaxID=5364 RepID=A0A5C3MZB8_9AGAM|nr:Clavaminate synthase-like protein [Heliocybe sulcata]